ncbi:MAG: phospholipid carrier-dependent glycosyltransferase [Acidobacteriota bacterium]
MREPGRGVLLAALILLLFAVWFEMPGSWLAEPDEPRYAEIPREMLATGDFVVPRLNGVPYFEKPPLLYWANAGALAALGETPFAARLPTRLAGLGTTLLVLFGVGALWGRRAGLFAAIFFLASPLPFVFSRLNLTDGVLTFFFTATLFAGFATMRARAAGRRAFALSALTGALAAGAFLSKGLVGVVLPGGILFFWALASRRSRALLPFFAGPAAPVFLLLVVPWLWLAERRAPGFLQFFFVHEHFQRFATNVSNRPGPIWYFVPVFVAGFLPGLPFFFAGLRRLRREPEALFFAIWFAVVFLVFSLSHSKLSPYLFPAFPAAAALAARGLLLAARSRRHFAISAAISALLVPAALFIPAAREAVAQSSVWPHAIAAGTLLAAGAVAALLLCRRADAALGALGAGWAAFYVILALIYPRTELASRHHDLATAARSASAAGARVVGFRTYLQTFPWELRTPIPVAQFTGELEPSWLSERDRSRIFWSREEFFRRWSSGERWVVLVKSRDADVDFRDVRPAPRLVAERRKYRVVANFDAAPGP